MTKTPAKFQKDRLKLRGVTSTSYTSHCVYGWTDGRSDGQTDEPILITPSTNVGGQKWNFMYSVETTNAFPYIFYTFFKNVIQPATYLF